jgi:acyl-coenzyme A thioesterase PaaI-like protein
MSDTKPIQDRLHKDNPIRHCYGCGADNAGGLRLKSFVEGDEVIARWRSQDHHEAYRGYLNGGIAATLIDCHSAWAAFAEECREKGFEPEMDPDKIPAGWTRAMKIEFLKATPLHAEILLKAKVVKKGRSSRTVACSLYADGEECVRGEVTIVMAAGYKES